MGLLKNLFIVAVACGLSTVALAKHSKLDSVLLPGTRVVAGDPQKNEFFIIAKNEVSQVKSAPVSPSEIKLTPTIKTALNMTFKKEATVLNKKDMPQIKTELRQASNKTKSSIQKNVNNKKLAQVEVIPHWMIHDETKPHKHLDASKKPTLKVASKSGAKDKVALSTKHLAKKTSAQDVSIAKS